MEVNNNELVPSDKMDLIKARKIIKEFAKNVEPIVVKNGVMQIDPSHPDYDFWVKD